MKRVKKVLALVFVVVAFGVVSAGCVSDDTAPTVRQSSGIATVSSVVTSADESPQYLDEYGLFYSTIRDDIVAINGVSYTNNLLSDEDFVVRPSVRRISLPSNTRYVSASEKGTISVTTPKLSAGTTYYFRLYTIGRDSDETQWKFALKVGQFTVASSDTKLKSIKLSTGKLSPKFKNTKVSYKTTIAAKKSKVKITVAPSFVSAQVKMKAGSGKWKITKSINATPKKGKSQKVLIKVTATDGKTVKNYSVKVTRKKK
jgi:hypothetical protein